MSSSPAETMAGVPWAEGASNETVVSASSELWLEADFQYSLFTVTYSVVFVLGLVGNALALYLLSCRADHLTHSYVYMINLALVDTLFVCVLPFKIHYHLHLNDWVFGDVACRVTGTLFYLNIYLSIAFFTCICVDRYVAVLHPFTYIQIRAGHCVLVASALWVVALGVAVPLVLGGPLHNEGLRNTTACFENFPTSSWAQRMAPYNVLALVFGFVVPFSLILVAYPLVARRISRIRRSVSRRKALSTIYIILAICALCFLPYHLTHLLHFLVKMQVIQDESFTSCIYKVRRVTLALVSLNCCLNPPSCTTTPLPASTGTAASGSDSGLKRCSPSVTRVLGSPPVTINYSRDVEAKPMEMDSTGLLQSHMASENCCFSTL